MKISYRRNPRESGNSVFPALLNSVLSDRENAIPPSRLNLVSEFCPARFGLGSRVRARICGQGSEVVAGRPMCAGSRARRSGLARSRRTFIPASDRRSSQLSGLSPQHEPVPHCGTPRIVIPSDGVAMATEESRDLLFLTSRILFLALLSVTLPLSASFFSSTYGSVIAQNIDSTTLARKI